MSRRLQAGVEVVEETITDYKNQDRSALFLSPEPSPRLTLMYQLKNTCGSKQMVMSREGQKRIGCRSGFLSLLAGSLN